MGGFLFEKINGPLSMGELKIDNRNPADTPSVTFNYFKEPKDFTVIMKPRDMRVKKTDSCCNPLVTVTMLLHI